MAPDNKGLEQFYGFDAVEGWLSINEARYLFEKAQSLTSGVIVEVGSYRGRSTVALGLGSLTGNQVPVYAVEPHEVFDGVLGGSFGPQDKVVFFNNIIKFSLESIVRLINLTSDVICVGWNKPVSLLWIDGDHRYEAVLNDFWCWERHLTSDAKIIFDDAKNEALGPIHLIKELEAGGKYAVEERVGKTVTMKRIL